MHLSSILAQSSLAVLTSAQTFQLIYPNSLGYNASLATQPPCGSFNPLDRTGSIIEAQAEGFPVTAVTDRPVNASQWAVNGALLTNDTSTLEWKQLNPISIYSFNGYLCVEVPANETSWAGLDGIVQIIQRGNSGIGGELEDLYQCSPVKFITGRFYDAEGFCRRNDPNPGPFSTLTTVVTVLPGSPVTEVPAAPSADAPTVTSADVPVVTSADAPVGTSTEVPVVTSTLAPVIPVPVPVPADTTTPDAPSDTTITDVPAATTERGVGTTVGGTIGAGCSATVVAEANRATALALVPILAAGAFWFA